MQIRVKGRHLAITTAIRDYALLKAEKLPRFYNRIQSVDVVAEAHDWQHGVEMIVHIAGRAPVIGRTRGTDLYACIDGVIAKLERQLSDQKSRKRNHKHSA